MAEGRKPAAWTMILIGALVIVLVGIVWVLGSRTANEAEAAADLTVPPVELPDAPRLPQAPDPVPVEPPTVPSPGPG